MALDRIRPNSPCCSSHRSASDGSCSIRSCSSRTTCKAGSASATITASPKIRAPYPGRTVPAKDGPVAQPVRIDLAGWVYPPQIRPANAGPAVATTAPRTRSVAITRRFTAFAISVPSPRPLDRPSGRTLRHEHRAGAGGGLSGRRQREGDVRHGSPSWSSLSASAPVGCRSEARVPLQTRTTPPCRPMRREVV